jgi:geranylgeranyl reductase family protein
MVRIRIDPRFDSDVVIVGAGPAGSAAACHLARSGSKVVVLERHSLPRDKVCGDFLSPVALVELEALGVTARDGFSATNVIDRAALFLDGKEMIARSIPKVEGLPDHGRVIPRKLIDHWIVLAALRAGAQVWERCSVTRFDTSSERVLVTLRGPDGERTLRTRLLLGADGSNSIIARLLRGHAPAAGGRIFAVRGYYEGVAGPSNQADLFFAAESFPGYYWLFPTGPDTANVGVGMVLETFPPTQDHLRDLLAKLIASDPALRRRLRDATPAGKITGWPLTTYDPQARLVDDRLMLLGDAAGLINPLNGEGIQYALLSGRWAAEVAAEATRSNDFSAASLAPYADRVERELRYDMALARLIVQAIRNRTLTPLWLRGLRVIVARAREDAAYSHVTGAILAGLMPVREALSVRVVGGTAWQAAVSLGLEAAGMLRRPESAVTAGLGAARLAAPIASEILRNPLETLRWAFGLTGCTADLALQAAKSLLGSARSPSGVESSAPGSARPAPVRIRLNVGPSPRPEGRD